MKEADTEKWSMKSFLFTFLEKEVSDHTILFQLLTSSLHFEKKQIKQRSEKPQCSD